MPPSKAGRRLYYRTKSTLLQVVRRGNRLILWVPEQGLGFGNFLYFFLQAHIRQLRGEDYRILRTPAMTPWLAIIPALEPLTIRQSDVRIVDRREWSGVLEHKLYQRFGIDFSESDLAGFISDRLLTSQALHDLPDPGDRLIVHIRRGDYYTDPGLRRKYGIDLGKYLEQAFDHIPNPTRIRVVSNDPDWCRDNVRLPATASFGNLNSVADFQAITNTRRLIGTNSTFSYWGGYVSQVRHADAVIVMPEFHCREEGHYVAYQLNPQWTAIRLDDWSELAGPASAD